MPFITTTVLAGTALVAGAAAVGVGMSQANKASKSAKSLAEQQMAEAKSEQTRLEEKYGLTPGETEREQRLFGTAQGEEKISMTGGLEAKTQAEKERRAGMTGEQLLAEGGPTTKVLLDKVAERLGMSGEELFRELSPTAGKYADIVGEDIQDPYATYESTLAPELELARQMVNQEANRRGVFAGLPEGGIRFEQLGRAGIDLAIKSANERMAYRQQALTNAVGAINAYSTLETGARGDASTLGTAALSEKERARAELDTLLSNMQNLQATAKGREANVAMGASGNAQQRIMSNVDELQGMYGLQKAQGDALTRQGLSTIGTIGSEGLLNETPATTRLTPGQGPVTIQDLMKVPGSDSMTRLEDMSGASISNWKRPQPNLRYRNN